MKFLNLTFIQKFGSDMAIGVMILLVAYGLKLHYSTAESEELAWILRPTAWLVELFSQREFLVIQGEGYMRADNRFIIAPACAGVNYMIVAFCMSGFYGIHSFKGVGRKLGYLIVCLVGSYCLTLLINGLRIEVAIALASARVEWEWLNPERVHRLAGIIIYLLSLLMLNSILQGMVNRRIRRNSLPISQGWAAIHASSPYFWYIMIAVGVPLLNRGWHGEGKLFIEHCLTIFSAALAVFFVSFLIKSTVCNHLIIGQGGNEKKR